MTEEDEAAIGYERRNFGVAEVDLEATGRDAVRTQLRRGKHGLPGTKSHQFVEAWLREASGRERWYERMPWKTLLTIASGVVVGYVVALLTGH